MDTNDTLHDRFLTYLEQYKPLIIKVAAAYCADKEQRQDLIQDIILQLFRAFPSFDETKASASTWTYRIALNVSISNLRLRTSIKKKHEAYTAVHTLLYWQDPDIEEKLQMMYRCIEFLKPMDKAIILLHLEEVSQSEAAQVMGMSPTNFSTRLHRIKNRLKENLMNINE